MVKLIFALNSRYFSIEWPIGVNTFDLLCKGSGTIFDQTIFFECPVYGKLLSILQKFKGMKWNVILTFQKHAQKKFIINK